MSSMTGEASSQWEGTATPTLVDHPSQFCWAQLPTWTSSTPSSGELSNMRYLYPHAAYHALLTDLAAA